MIPSIDPAAFTEVADRIHVLRYPVLDVNVTLVVGRERALLVDTLATAGQAEQLADAVHRTTHLPVQLINTHHHFDHWFGNATLMAALHAAAPWAHETTVRYLGDHGPALQRQWHDEWISIDTALAEGLAAVTLVPPDRPVRGRVEIDLGGRTAVLSHPGRGHTAGDLVVLVPDAAALVAGDLLEEGAPPQFEDGYPLAWPHTLANLATQLPPSTTVIPGHGSTTDRAFMQAQQANLAELAHLVRCGHRDAAPASQVAADAAALSWATAGARRVRLDSASALTAVSRGYRELDAETRKLDADNRG